MSFALVHKNKNKEADSKTSTSARPSPSHHINNLAMTPHDYIIHLQHTIGNQAVRGLCVLIFGLTLQTFQSSQN